MSIYSNVKDLEQLIDDCFDEETGEINEKDFEAYEQLKKELTGNGLEKLAQVRANKQAIEFGIKSEIERLKNALKRVIGDIDWIEGYMLSIYNESQKDKKGKVQAGTFNIGTRKSTQVIVDDSFNNELYQTIKEVKSIDKMALKRDLKDGAIIDGATLKEVDNLTVK